MSQRSLALCGMAAPPLFVIAILIFAAVRPDYSHLTKAVSELGVWGAPHALAWNAIGFIAVGLLITVFSWGLFRATTSWAAFIFVGLSGLGFAGAGFFPADMGDLSAFSSQMHLLTSFGSFGAFVMGAFILCWRFLKVPQWRVVAISSGVLGLLAVVTLPVREMPVPPGLAQRVSFLIYLAWVEGLAATLWVNSQVGPGPPGRITSGCTDGSLIDRVRPH